MSVGFLLGLVIGIFIGTGMGSSSRGCGGVNVNPPPTTPRPWSSPKGQGGTARRPENL
jgi:hypothetical protein